MRELELAGIPSIDATRPRQGGRAAFPLSRTAFIASMFAHAIAGYALSRNLWSDAASPPRPRAEFFLFEIPAPRPPEAVPVAPPVAEPTVVVEAPPLAEPAPSAEPAPRASIDFDEERRRAVNQVVESRAGEREYLTFSIDDVASPRAEPEPDKPSIFDGTGGP